VYREETHAMPSDEDRTRLEKDRAPCAGITQIRFEGLWVTVTHTLSAVRSPVGLLMFR
jgi:hypothetical protein